jgi:hypothetical protein
LLQDDQVARRLKLERRGNRRVGIGEEERIECCVAGGASTQKRHRVEGVRQRDLARRWHAMA